MTEDNLDIIVSDNSDEKEVGLKNIEFVDCEIANTVKGVVIDVKNRMYFPCRQRLRRQKHL